MLEYNAAGDLVRKEELEQTQEFEYSPQGDLRSITQSGVSTLYTHNSHGQIETIKGPRGTTRLGYSPDGRLRAIEFTDGTVHEYRYSALGFRERIERNDGSHTTYEYDVAGNLIHSDGHKHTADSEAAGQVFEINDYNQPEIIRFSNGDSVKVTYDATGNPETITTSDPEAPALEYLYDATNRLVAVQDGETVSGSYVYEETEPDLRLQMDYRTMRVASGAVRQSASIGDLLSVVYARPYGSLGDFVHFDEATRTFDLASDYGVSSPNAVTLNSLRRRKLTDVDAGDLEARTSFDLPSNVMFVPPEYATVNCGTGCVFNGVIVTGNNASGTISVPVGSTVSLNALKASGSSCSNMICHWTLNGVPMQWPALFPNQGPFTRQFSSLGINLVEAECECSPCDLIRTGNLTVNVACTATVSVSSPAHNPNPSNANWQTNYSFLSSSVIPASASTSPSGASSLVQWTITPTIGQIQNLVPSNGKGPGVSFRPNVSHTPGGSLATSPALSYAIKAAVCSSQDTNTITQDERDRIRQEFLHNGATVIPARQDFTTVTASAHFPATAISQSGYTLMVGNCGTLGEAVRAEYNQRLRSTLGNPSFPDQNLVMTSGWRNPERNEYFGGAVDSLHQYGRAVDLAVLASTATASGLTMAQLWAILEAAGDAVGTGFCEDGTLQVTCSNPAVDHVHVQN